MNGGELSRKETFVVFREEIRKIEEQPKEIRY